MKTPTNHESVKVRKQGNSTTITLPKYLNVKVGQEYYPIKQDNGQIILIPKVEDYFSSNEMDLTQHESYKPEGAEWHD
ncbi:AbrB family transcriptional regulator [Lentilactobacillus fungorum]|uniref:AbrB family transcriptional regulator n=1 Tax=Lentilactobacillus fungorum TaxID=2201250 RepID=A0ABQ3VWV6_9LACO|nr:AbrB/MazE/SpoVT family DNA-binding domain-containing protein [Lentilactobacillus fungorum]GHP13385.1 AbrB family transcriptional regulator [Lentilactobacillus fungorum]